MPAWPDSTSSGTSLTTTASSGTSAASSTARSRTSGWTMAFSRARASGSAKTTARQRRPVQGAVGGEHPLAEGLDDRGQARRAGLDDLAGDRVGVDDHGAPRGQQPDTVLLPEPIPPVNPIRSTRGQ